MFEYTQFSIKVHYYNKRGLKICLICYKLFRCSENYELQTNDTTNLVHLKEQEM